VKGLYQSLQGRQEDQGKVDFRNREWNLIKQIGWESLSVKFDPCRSNRIFVDPIASSCPDLPSLCGTISCRDMAKVQTSISLCPNPGVRSETRCSEPNSEMNILFGVAGG